jgi:hypothetical protein
MLNHFRTLLVNLSYFNTPDDHIPIGYQARQLPLSLKKIYDILFPPYTNRDYKLFLVSAYLNIIRAAGFDNKVLAYDNRISYDLNDTARFQVHRYSNPIISNSLFPLHVYGEFDTIGNDNITNDTFTISQDSNLSSVGVFSKARNKYLINRNTFELFSDALIPVTFSGTFLSDPILIGTTGLSFSIEKTTQNFTDSNTKIWSFTAQGPYNLNIESTFSSLSSINPFKLLASIDTANNVADLEFIWNTANNVAIKLASLLVAYVQKVNNL